MSVVQALVVFTHLANRYHGTGKMIPELKQLIVKAGGDPNGYGGPGGPGTKKTNTATKGTSKKGNSKTTTKASKGSSTVKNVTSHSLAIHIRNPEPGESLDDGLRDLLTGNYGAIIDDNVIAQCRTGKVNCITTDNGFQAVVKQVDMATQYHLLPELEHEVVIYNHLKSLQGRHIPRVLGHGGHPEFLSLYTMTMTHGGVPIGHAGGLSVSERRSAMDALKSVHSLGVIHGDITEFNVLVQRDNADGSGCCQLIDFAFGKLMSSVVNAEQCALEEEEELERVLSRIPCRGSDVDIKPQPVPVPTPTPNAVTDSSKEPKASTRQHASKTASVSPGVSLINQPTIKIRLPVDEEPGKPIELENVNLIMTVADMKQMVADHVHVELLRFLFSGRELTDDTQTLLDCGINDGSTIDTAIRCGRAHPNTSPKQPGTSNAKKPRNTDPAISGSSPHIQSVQYGH